MSSRLPSSCSWWVLYFVNVIKIYISFPNSIFIISQSVNFLLGYNIYSKTSYIYMYIVSQLWYVVYLCNFMITQYIVNSYKNKLSCIGFTYFIYSANSLLYIWASTYTARMDLTQNFDLQILLSTYLPDRLECYNWQHTTWYAGCVQKESRLFARLTWILQFTIYNNITWHARCVQKVSRLFARSTWMLQFTVYNNIT